MVGDSQALALGACGTLVTAAWRGWGGGGGCLGSVQGSTSLRYFPSPFPVRTKEEAALELFFMPRLGLDPGYIRFQAGRLALSNSLSCSK